MLRIIAIALVFLCGCDVSSDSPLSPLSEARLQKQFIGTWRSTDCPDNQVNFVHVSSATGRFGTGPNKALMRFLFVSQPTDDHDKVMHHEFLGYFSILNNQFYLNLMTNVDYKFNKPHELTNTSIKEHSYRLHKVRVLSDDHVQLIPISVEATARLVETTSLSGSISKRKGALIDIRSVHLTSSTESLVSSVTNSKNTDLFDKEGISWHFRRLK